MPRPLASVALVAALATATSAPDSDHPPLYDDTPEVAAGTYLVDTEWFGAPFLITVPDGWTADADFVTWGPHSSYSRGGPRRRSRRIAVAGTSSQ